MSTMSLVSNRCSFCQELCKEKKDLYQCARCGVFAYCGEECQAKDWARMHHKMCKAIAFKKACAAEDDDGRAPIVSVSYSCRGYIFPGKQIPDGIPYNFGIFQVAERYISSMPKDESRPIEASERQMKCRKYIFLGEVHYMAFYNDLIIHTEEWVDFFSHWSHCDYVSGACQVLLGLIDINLERGEYEFCGEVLEVASEISLTYKLLGDLHAAHFQKTELDKKIKDSLSIEYYLKTKRSQINIKLERYKENTPLFRDLCAFEADLDNSTVVLFGEGMHLKSLQTIVRELTHSRVPTNAEEISSVPDATVIVSMEAFRLVTDAGDRCREDTKLLECGHCNQQETALGEFKVCQRCNEAYCGKVCQKSAWNSHKKVCGKVIS